MLKAPKATFFCGEIAAKAKKSHTGPQRWGLHNTAHPCDSCFKETEIFAQGKSETDPFIEEEGKAGNSWTKYKYMSVNERREG